MKVHIVVNTTPGYIKTGELAMPFVVGVYADPAYAEGVRVKSGFGSWVVEAEVDESTVQTENRNGH